MEAKTKTTDGLVEICKVISWLDDRRWNPGSPPFHEKKSFNKDLSAQEIILTHWLIYITDRQMPAGDIWEKGVRVFAPLAHEFSQEALPSHRILRKYYRSDTDKLGKKHFSFRNTLGETFASRFITIDYQSILQTLGILSTMPYNRSLVGFILTILRDYQDRDDLLIRVACALNLLTYRLDHNKANIKEALRALQEKSEFEAQLAEFKRTSTSGKKRLWASIRDYLKGPLKKKFVEAIGEAAGTESEVFVRLWNRLPMEQLEVPGDVWNNNEEFRDHLIGQVIKAPHGMGISEIIRRIYRQTSELRTAGFYPEQFDVTFDFVPRMCKKILCDVCPFGEQGASAICIPTDEQYCPVALVTCGYIRKCNWRNEKCPIREGVARAVCETMEMQ